MQAVVPCMHALPRAGFGNDAATQSRYCAQKTMQCSPQMCCRAVCTCNVVSRHRRSQAYLMRQLLHNQSRSPHIRRPLCPSPGSTPPDPRRNPPTPATGAAAPAAAHHMSSEPLHNWSWTCVRNFVKEMFDAVSDQHAQAAAASH